MGIRNYKPTSAGRRGGSVSDFAEITDRKKRPEKSLVEPLHRSGGRNNQGKITVRFRGGGHKRLYRVIDFRRDKRDVSAEVTHIEYDPNRSCRIALLKYDDGEMRYILAPNGLAAGMRVIAGDNVEAKVGNSMPLSAIPVGLQVHNIEMVPGRGGALCRAAGMAATLNAREADWAQITLPSGEVRRVHSSCRATVGTVGNAEHMNIVIGKAGRKRWLGRKPHVRGVAQNPNSHPMGGGEGRSSGGRHPCSPTAKLSKGGNTRNRRKTSSRAIQRRRTTKRYGQKVLPRN
ncbi:MAG TPA: 50S ribosomal protein L2 [Planctomycetia bacterium]|nr:50S ribosomal protein L2 [Planctomycetia bacterium]